MFDPAIPFIELPELRLLQEDALFQGFPPSDVTIKPFGTLVALGVYVGTVLAMRQGRRAGLNERALASFMVWVVAVGFVGGHVLDLLFYYPGRVLEDPWSLFRIWDGQSSFGGFVGALVGGLWFRHRHRTKILPYVDMLSSAFPAAWVFGRMGCSVAHDHPGLPSDAWIAVQYADGGRYDLGLYEMILTIPLALCFLWLRRSARPWGFYTALMCIAYAPTRFSLDFLRAREAADGGHWVSAVDPRYALLTPAQWACLGLLLLGFGLLIRLFLAPPSAGLPEVPARFVEPPSS